MELVLVRHGESVWNREGRLQGQTLDVPLTELGRSQAELAARRVAALAPAGTPVLASDQLRARQTAQIIADGLGSRVETTPLLREQALGQLEGKRLDELVAEPVPEGKDISEVCWGGGESIQQVHERCVRLVEQMRRESVPVMVLVGHGDALRVLLSVLDGRGHRDVDWCPIGNGEVFVRHLPGG
ncbi:histidine phosphatase family protein [Luteococcus sp. OSA5]|uniref:histidine phosphatase family protein n=1 Tax=Luteococcus sp. OSA5 TaxID=3401630 RepID=UPI003B42D33A